MIVAEKLNVYNVYKWDFADNCSECTRKGERKFMGKVRKGIQCLLSLCLAFILLVPGVNAAAAESESAEIGNQYEAEQTGRERINFNRSWKFYRGDAENAGETDYDDSGWTDVALPHNFSVPYDMSSDFYVGYGWYRKSFEVPENWDGKRVFIEFEGAFQAAEVYVNETLAGIHEGGYTGFEYDITDYIHTGQNQISVRVNNIWQPDLSPRAGDHQFTGGIYRDVYLNITDDVHVTWYGTVVTTPDLTNPGFDDSAVNVLDSYTSEEEIRQNIAERQSNVNVQTEVKNDSETEKEVWVKQEVVDAHNVVVAQFESGKQRIAPGEIYNFNDTSEKIQDIELWDTENPYLYHVYTTVYADGEPVDIYESPLGFRWAQYKNDGFYLNGEKVLLDGANAHQDHGGWADAVTNEGFYRDVKMLKEAGMNFIRGSHYPHDPSYAEACDELGMLFWCESVFWGMGGCAGKDEPAAMTASDWFKDAYPQNPEDEAAFEESCKQALTDMIRVNRNHPSVINWSMGNEVFFTDSDTQQKAKDLVNELRNLSHLLDPTRKAGMGGVQREGYDSLEICDIAGYNGDGGKIENLTMPNLVAEYGSKAADRPGEYRPFYDQIAKAGTTDEYQLQTNSAGLSLWCAFHHGTIGGDGLAKMGIIDYYRLPLNSWYWYREHNTGTAPEQSVEGKAVRMELSASQTALNNDGTDDAQIIVTMKNEDDQWVNQTQEVTLKVVSGPGVFPTGKEYSFVPNRTIRDGKAAIEFRSYYSGETIIRATSEGLPAAEIRLTTVNTSGGEEGQEPDGFYVVQEEDPTEKIEEPVKYGSVNAASQRPAFPSSNDKDRTLAVDGKLDTSWTAGVTGSGEYWMTDLEFTQYIYKIKLGFSEDPYPYKIEVAMDKDSGPWTTVAEYTKDTIADRPYEESIGGNEARYVKITFTDVPENEKAFLSECEVYGATSSQSPQYAEESRYLSDMEWQSVETFWGQAGRDVSCEGNPIRVGGQTYEKGLGLHADSEVVYDLGGKYSRFQAVAGIDNEVGGNEGDAVFQVFADEKLIYEKNLRTGESDRVDLSVSGVDQLKLVTTQNGRDSNDHTDWADAKVLGAIRDTTKSSSGYRADFTSDSAELRAGETFKTRIGLENQDSDQPHYAAALTLYDEEGRLTDVEMTDDYLDQGDETAVYLEMEMPTSIKGYSLHVNVWKKDTLEMIAKTVLCSSQGDASECGDPSVKWSWTKVDGEDMEKVGNWKMWPSDAAYNGTETYTGDNDTPLTENVSISYTFKGEKVRIGAKVDQSQKGAEVYIDGEKAGIIDNSSVEVVNEYRQVFESQILTDEEHVLTLIPIGKFGVDYIEYGQKAEDGSAEDTAKDELKEQWRQFIAVVESDDVDRYTLESRKTVADSADSAYLVLRNDNVSEEEIGKTVRALQQALQELRETDSDELSTAVLEYALSLAETADTEGVVDSVVKIFNDAKAAAEDILARVQAGDPSVTQEMVDESWQNLIKAMQYLSFKQGDKTDLEKVIDMAKSLDLSEYLDEGRQAFTDALAAAEAVLANGDAMQDEVDQSWRDLLKAMSELRLKPNKDALKDLIDEANAMSTEGADEETITAFQNALAAAMSVYDNEQATEEEVAAAEEGLQAALDQLRAAAGGTEDQDNSGDGNTGNGGSSQDTSGKDNASAQTDTTKNNSAQKSVKTGDTAAPIAGMAAVMMLAAAAGVIAYRRRRETR